MKYLYINCLTFCVLLTASLSGLAQKKEKLWTEWKEKEVLKILNDSPWGQTQAETDTSEMTYTPTAQGQKVSSRPLDNKSTTNTNQGALNQATNINYRIRLLTAKPIRQAIARLTELKNPQLAEQLKAFAEQKTDKYIVVTVDYDSTDQRFSTQALQMFNSVNTGALKNNTYLEVKDGTRVFLDQYIVPSNDGMGAKFVFPRVVDGKQFVTAESGFLRFYSELSKNIKLNMRFKISEMMYEGALEY